jgi:hypothetical protein
VSREQPSERAPGARPVADAPVEQLLARADELARRWAVSLLSARSLSEMSAVPLEDLARGAPTLCAQVARSLRADAELAQLLASTPGQWFAHADDTAACVRDMEALRSVLWRAAMAALDDPSPALVADLADRLAFVCASTLAAALAAQQPVSAGGPDLPDSPATRGREQILYSSPPLSPSGRGAVLIDERDELAASPSAGRARNEDAATPPVRRRESAQAAASAQGTATPRPPGESSTKPRARPWDIPLSDASAHAPEAPRADAQSWPGTDVGAAEMRITRGRGAAVDERA